MNYYETEDFSSCYVAKVKTEQGERYVYSKRALVCDLLSAKRYNTLKSLKRYMKQGGFSNYEVVVLKTEQK